MEHEVDRGQRADREQRGLGGVARRWSCHCSEPPVLLATVEDGQVNLKVRDRYYHIEGLRGRVRATCPRCGKQHVLTLEGGESRDEAPRGEV